MILLELLSHKQITVSDYFNVLKLSSMVKYSP
jgi:hypothetical protein